MCRPPCLDGTNRALAGVANAFVKSGQRPTRRYYLPRFD